MRRAVEYSLLFFLLCRMLPAQTSQACKSDLRDLKLAGHAITDDGFARRKTSLQFLFSQDGIDVYSANDFNLIWQKQRYGEPFDGALTAILVYQNEYMRQSEIQSLRDEMRMMDLLFRSSHPPLSNLKFSAWRFKLIRTGANGVSERKWLVLGIEYFEPVSCLPAEYRRLPSSEGYLEASMASQNLIFRGMPEDNFPANQALLRAPNSVLSRTLEAMLAMLRKQRR